jgi:hypothetical protein
MNEIEYLDYISQTNHLTERNEMFLRKNMEEEEEDEDEEFPSESNIQNQCNLEEIENFHETGNQDDFTSSYACERSSSNSAKRKIFAVKRLIRKKCLFKVDRISGGSIIFNFRRY